MLSSDLYTANMYAQVGSTSSQEAIPIVQLLEDIEKVPFDRQSIPQASLDLANKFRTSLFPWRGQFSPELVELFLNRYSQDSSVILDPFAGSGTTLFEAARKGLTPSRTPDQGARSLRTGPKIVPAARRRSQLQESAIRRHDDRYRPPHRPHFG